MTTLRLTRFLSGPDGTFGTITYKGRPLCVTCEDPWFRNATGVSCIPPGNYSCRKHTGPKFQDVWQLLDVPKRTAILIHAGNTIEDTHGCVLVGNGFGEYNGFPAIQRSQETLKMLRSVLPGEFDLIIAGPSGMDYSY